MNQCKNRVTTPFGDLQIDVDNLFDQVFGNRPKGSQQAKSSWTPRVQVTESETRYELKMELPGVDPSSVNLEMKDNRLEIHGTKEKEELEEATKSLRDERLTGEFQRSFEFPQQVDADQIAAEFKNGVLNVALPKSENVLPRKIEIKVAD
ncbi:MAG: Hsp20/alpha crystallin family protein [Planctomycetota bacterium]